MNAEKTAALLRALRTERGFTQRELADRLQVSDKTVSKWERAQGCPDIALLPALAEVFGVRAEQLLRGELSPNRPEGGNLRRMRFFRCPVCGAVTAMSGMGELSCCGRVLTPLMLQPEEEEHTLTVEPLEEEWLLTFSHPMEKAHYLAFVAAVTEERLLLVRLYPEQGGELRLPILRRGRLYFCCSRDGLFYREIR